MKRKNIKTYEEYAVDYELTKDFAQTQLSDNMIKNSYKIKYEKLFVDYLLMKDVVDDITNENINDVIIAIKNNDFDTDSKKFYDSFNKSERLQYLTPYTVEDIKSFKTYKVRGYNIGFAIKRNGDIILVHNNENNIKGIGDLLINKAIEFGGDHLDHFDGYLTGFYKKNGFSLKNNIYFDEQYKPEGWEYERIDIYKPTKSIYAKELNVTVKEFENAEIRYNNGRPDVVYRKLNEI